MSRLDSRRVDWSEKQLASISVIPRSGTITLLNDRMVSLEDKIQTKNDE